MKSSINEHASVRLETAQGVIYFDPFRITEAKNDADFIFVTHSHFDHLSAEDIAKTANENTVFVMPESIVNDALEIGIAEQKIVALKPCDKTEVAGLEIEAVPAYNTNKPMHKKEYGWLGFVVTVDGERIYVCGDTDVIDEGIAVDCDVAFVPVGGTYTMDYAEAADFVNQMEPKRVVPYHYGSIVGDKDMGEKFAELVNDGIEVELLI